jgi:hypothetical protein
MSRRVLALSINLSVERSLLILPFGVNKSAVSPSYRRRPMTTARANAGTAMCERCIELDGKIEHYQRLAAGITDQRTLDGIKTLIEQMQAQKVGLHPEQEE